MRKQSQKSRSLGEGMIKPDLVLNMKRVWFAKIWNGEKTIEYREKKPYWKKRIGGWAGGFEPIFKFVEMRLGYKGDGPVLLIQVNSVDVGKCPYEGWTGDYYRLHFDVVGYYWREKCGTYTPILVPMKMKENGGDGK